MRRPWPTGGLLGQKDDDRSISAPSMIINTTLRNYAMILENRSSGLCKLYGCVIKTSEMVFKGTAQQATVNMTSN
jgi:hypothetical protein